MNDDRDYILSLLGRYSATDAKEVDDCGQITRFVRANANCFGKANSAGHVTGSAFVLDPAGRVLMTHHAKLNRWLQLGGHSDPGEANPQQTALREAEEESGLTDLVPFGPEPLDIDVHQIPARKGQPAHDHLDFRYVFQTMSPEAIERTEESHALRWFTLDELADLDLDPALRRAVSKVRMLLD